MSGEPIANLAEWPLKLAAVNAGRLVRWVQGLLPEKARSISTRTPVESDPARLASARLRAEIEVVRANIEAQRRVGRPTLISAVLSGCVLPAVPPDAIESELEDEELDDEDPDVEDLDQGWEIGLFADLDEDESELAFGIGAHALGDAFDHFHSDSIIESPRSCCDFPHDPDAEMGAWQSHEDI
jgi:hypothetical protein